MCKRGLNLILFFSILFMAVNVFAADDAQDLREQVKVLQARVAQLENMLAEKNQPAEDYDPYTEMDRIRANINHMFDDSFNRAITRSMNVQNQVTRTTIDLKDEGKSYSVCIDMPGMDKGDINIEAQGRQLLISAKKDRSLEKQDPSANYVSKEKNITMISRSITLPKDADTAKPDAQYKDGKLTIRLLKLPSGSDEKSKAKIAVH